jgi:hypothetical protein
MEDLNFLFKDGITEAFLQRYTNYIAHRLNDETIEIFSTNNITLLLNIAPGNVISNFAFPFTERKFGHIIIIEKNILEYCRFTLEEASAMILHEFGHIFNNPEDKTQREFYADYYAKSLGFGNELASALTKFLQKDFPFINTETNAEIQNRINDLQNIEQEPLVGNLKILRTMPNAE